VHQCPCEKKDVLSQRHAARRGSQFGDEAGEEVDGLNESEIATLKIIVTVA
jgi:hypothetical protein